MIEHYKNLSIENIIEEHEGVVYVEEWKPIQGWESCYHASSFGRIKSLKKIGSNNQFKNEDVIKAQKVGTRGYLDVTLCNNGESKTLRVARIICNLFVPNPENKPQVNHKKGIKTDNRYLMIEWNTISENQKHSFRELNRIPTSFWTGKVASTAKKVLCIDTGEVFPSATAAANKIGVSNDMLSMVCRKERKTAKGYHFKYLN